MLLQMALHLGSRDALLSVFVCFCNCMTMCAYRPEGWMGGWREMQRTTDAECCPEQLLTGAMCSPLRPISAWLHSQKKRKKKEAFFRSFNSKHIRMNDCLVYINIKLSGLFLTHWIILDIEWYLATSAVHFYYSSWILGKQKIASLEQIA